MFTRVDTEENILITMLRILYRSLMQARYTICRCICVFSIGKDDRFKITLATLGGGDSFSRDYTRSLIIQLYRFLNATYPHNSASNSLSFPLTLTARSILISCAEGLDIRIYCHYPFLSRFV